ncbi:MAG: cytochrome c oxidase subunit 3 [Chloroflexi bacterium]|nr:cytochrome c oxidase subunit 3 [Chloroflexota bacterium]
MARQLTHRTTRPTHAAHDSYWPIILAVALTLTVVGLTTHLAISLVGAALSIVVIVAWTLERFQGPSPIGVAPVEAMHLPALSPGEAEVEVPLHVGRHPGWWGLFWFIASEAIFFGNLIAAYLYLRFSAQVPPSSALPRLELLTPSIFTIILLLSGVPAYYADRAIKRDDRRGLQLGLVLAALLGGIFLAGQGREYLSLGFTPQTNIFAAGFFTLTGFHGLHVVVGIGLLLAVFLLSLGGRFSSRRHFAVEVASTYWHFVDVVWIFLFTLLYVMQ